MPELLDTLPNESSLAILSHLMGLRDQRQLVPVDGESPDRPLASFRWIQRVLDMVSNCRT
jgi:hypothetical protein